MEISLKQSLYLSELSTQILKTDQLIVEEEKSKWDKRLPGL